MRNHFIKEFNIFSEDLKEAESELWSKLHAFNWDTLEEFMHAWIKRASIRALELEKKRLATMPYFPARKWEVL